MNDLTKKEEIAFYWSCMLGPKSHINLLGKIVMFPLIVALGIMVTVFELVFTKGTK